MKLVIFEFPLWTVSKGLPCSKTKASAGHLCEGRVCRHRRAEGWPAAVLEIITHRKPSKKRLPSHTTSYSATWSS